MHRHAHPGGDRPGNGRRGALVRHPRAHPVRHTRRSTVDRAAEPGSACSARHPPHLHEPHGGSFGGYLGEFDPESDVSWLHTDEFLVPFA